MVLLVERGGANSDQLMEVRLLGPRQTTWAGEALRIQRRQPRALLYRLAVRPEWVSRAHLCLLLWPDLTEPEARRHLSNQLYNLRRALPDPGVVQDHAGQLTLDSQRIWSDVAAFEHLSKRSDIQSLRQAVDLYRGPFLDGFAMGSSGAYDAWAAQEARTLERQHLDNLAALMSVCADQGDYDAAIAYARRYLEVDDLAEQVHRQLIDLYTAQGNRSAALRQYERCAAVLRRELGVDPLPETQELYRSALVGDEDNHSQASPHPKPPLWTTLPSLEAPLVGREKATAILRAALAQTRSGAGSAVLISGEAGAGKSRFLEEFVTKHGAAATVLLGAGYEAEGEMPYLALLEALRPLLPAIDWTSLGADPLHLAALLPLLPELRRHVPDLPDLPAADQELAESPVFRALAHLVLHLARQRPPLILCLDDLHWTDETTRSWMAYLGRRLSEAPLLLLGAYRVEETGIVAALRASLARLNILQEVALQGLTEREVGQLIQQLSGQAEGGETFSRRLHRQTGGNPFFLLETLRVLFEAGVLYEDGSGWRSNLDQVTVHYSRLQWPGSVVETVRHRVGQLDPSTIQILEAAAVLGRRFELDLLQATSGRSALEVVDALDKLTARQLIIGKQGHYQFRHDLIQAIVSNDLSYGRQKLLHRRAAEVLERHEPDNVALLARHFSAAGEVSKAAHYALQAGDRARSLFAHREAVRFYKQALAYQEGSGAPDKAARTHIRLGLTHQIAHDYQRAQRAFESSFTLRRQTHFARPASHPPAPRPLRLGPYSAPHQAFLLTESAWLAPDSSPSRDLYNRQLFSGLLRADRSRTVQPELAKTWEISDDGRRYTFHLRDDAVWSDSQPVTARDFEFAWKQTIQKKRHSAGLDAIQGAGTLKPGGTAAENIVAVHSVGAHTLEVGLAEPAEAFLNHLTDHRMAPVPRHAVERHGKAWTEPGNLVTNGPFLLESWSPEQGAVLTRNPAYFGPFRGNLRQVVISNQRLSPAGQLAAYRAGQVDILALEPENFQARFQYAEEYCQVEAIETHLLGFGSTESPFHDRRVRQALGLAIDKVALVNLTLGSFFRPARGGFLPFGSPGYSSGISPPYDPERASRLLAKAGYPGGKGFPDVELATLAARVTQAQALQRDWDRHLGIQIQLKVMPRPEFFKRYRQAPLFIVGWSNWHLDPYNFLRVGVRYLASYWRHMGYERLIEEASRLDDQTQRLRQYQRADRMLTQAAAIVPLYYGLHHYLVKPWLKISLPEYALKDAILEPH